MKNRYRLYRRPKGGVFYAHDSETGKQESLSTRDRAEAMSLLNAHNESVRLPLTNLQIAKVYLAGTDSGVSTRTWQNALDAVVETKPSLESYGPPVMEGTYSGGTLTIPLTASSVAEPIGDSNYGYPPAGKLFNVLLNRPHEQSATPPNSTYWSTAG